MVIVVMCCGGGGGLWLVCCGGAGGASGAGGAGGAGGAAALEYKGTCLKRVYFVLARRLHYSNICACLISVPVKSIENIATLCQTKLDFRHV